MGRQNGEGHRFPGDLGNPYHLPHSNRSPRRTNAMARLKLDPIRARNLSNDYAKWLLQEQRERTPSSGKQFAKLHTPGGRRFHGFTEEQVCTIIGGDYYG